MLLQYKNLDLFQIEEHTHTNVLETIDVSYFLF
jgi:hypothetical protein